MRNDNGTAVLRSLVCLMFTLSLMSMAVSATAEGEVSSGVDLKFWGRAKFDMQYDTGRQAVDFMGYLKDDSTEQFSFNPRDTRLGFKAGSAQGEWTYSGVFEIDFYGANAGNSLIPRMRLGYAEAKKSNGLSIRGGQDWIPVAQQNPATLDFGVQSWSGNLWWRVPQVTVRYKPDNIEFLVSAMKHRVSNSQEQQEKMPWLLGRVAFSDLLGEGSLVALGGGMRSASDVTFTMDNIAPPPDVLVSTADYSSHLVALEFKAPVGEKFVVKGEVYTGKGLGREFVHYGFDYNPWHPDGATEIESKGGFVSLSFAASDKVGLNGGFGTDDPKDEDLNGSGAPYLKNQTIFANLKYKVTKQFGWGVEFINFTTTVADVDDERDLTGQRFTASWWYIF
ncbi:MAG: hypothetical protein ABFS42_03840 [Candidatus Krumholzibacteriota bacterium]